MVRGAQSDKENHWLGHPQVKRKIDENEVTWIPAIKKPDRTNPENALQADNDDGSFLFWTG